MPTNICLDTCMSSARLRTTESACFRQQCVPEGAPLYPLDPSQTNAEQLRATSESDAANIKAMDAHEETRSLH